jgi:hypothetical protein
VARLGAGRPVSRGDQRAAGNGRAAASEHSGKSGSFGARRERPEGGSSLLDRCPSRTIEMALQSWRRCAALFRLPSVLESTRRVTNRSGGGVLQVHPDGPKPPTTRQTPDQEPLRPHDTAALLSEDVRDI